MTPIVGKPEYHKKTWGYELWLANRLEYCGKILHVKNHRHTSMHYHLKKDETFYVLKGRVIIALRDKNANDTDIELIEGDSLHIPAGQMHQIIGIDDSDLIEVSTTHDEEDSYRVTRSSPEEAEIKVDSPFAL